MDIELFAQKIMELMPRMLRGFAGRERHDLATGKITLPQFWALCHLSRQRRTMKALAGLLAVTPAAGTGLIDRLICQGLVQRKPDAKDRRITWIELSPKGTKVIQRIERQKRKAIIDVFGKVSASDRRHYLAVMEKVAKITAAAVVIGFFSGQRPALANDAPLTLKECYRLALKQSEVVAVDAERIREASGRFTQAFGTLLPQVSFLHKETRYDAAGTDANVITHEQRFVFSQTLFSGFKEFAAMYGSKYETRQHQEEKKRAEQLLFTDVSDAFYLLLEERQDLETLATIRKALNERISDLKRRENLGRSRRSEVVSTETQLYSVEDELQQAKSQENIASELLSFLIGRPVGMIVDNSFVFDLKAEESYRAAAPSRADVKAAQNAWNVSRSNVTIAQSGFLPTVTAEADYFNGRNTVAQDKSWQGMLTVNVPIFEGTTTMGQVKQANAQARENKLLFDRAVRAAGQDIHNAYVNAEASFLRTKVLEKAFKSAQLNYDLQKEDYKHNVVNNLDVLTALQNLQDVRRNYTRVTLESKRFYWQLQVASGSLPVDVLDK